MVGALMGKWISYPDAEGLVSEGLKGSSDSELCVCSAQGALGDVFMTFGRL